ncbi:MAG: alpha-hydroxy-acid oxidizing protein, partial [Halobacteriota archaeon]
MTEYGLDRMREIYVSGATGDYTPFPVRHDELRARAHEEMTDEAYGYVAGAAGREDTARDNEADFDLYRLEPEVLRDVSTRDLSVDVLGREYAAPLGLAPVGVQSIVHPDGERASASAAADHGLPYVTSTVSSTRLED